MMDIGDRKWKDGDKKMNMKTINFTKFPLLDRDGNITEVDIAKDFFNIAFKNATSRDDIIFNLSLEEDADIELTDEAIDYFKRYLAMIDPKTYLYSFEKYVE